MFYLFMYKCSIVVAQDVIYLQRRTNCVLLVSKEALKSKSEILRCLYDLQKQICLYLSSPRRGLFYFNLSRKQEIV